MILRKGRFAVRQRSKTATLVVDEADVVGVAEEIGRGRVQEPAIGDGHIRNPVRRIQPLKKNSLMRIGKGAIADVDVVDDRRVRPGVGR